MEEKRKIISIEEDEAQPDGCGLERFLQEVNILELEGVYFSPNRKTVSTGKKAKTLAELYSQPVTITLSSYGQPGELAYKVLQAAFLKLAEQGFETNGVVLFSRRELAALVGKTSFGGNQSDQLFSALMQLYSTGVACALQFKESNSPKSEKKARVVNFRIFSMVAFEGAPRGRFARVAIRIDENIVENFKNRHISYFNWERMRGLDMVGMMLYKRFFRHLANIYRDGKDQKDRNALKFEKDYEQVCTSWLGMKPRPFRFHIERQLGKRLKDLKQVRLLRECNIEPKANGKGFKIVGYAGSGFFKDYEDIYRRKLPGSEPTKIEPEPLLLLSDFHRGLGRAMHEFSPKEVAFARELLKRYSPDEVHDLIAFARAKAAETKFDMKWFSALSLYEGQWKSSKKQRAEAFLRAAAVASCRFCNEYGYLEFEDGSVGRCPHEGDKVALIHVRKPIRSFRAGLS